MATKEYRTVNIDAALHSDTKLIATLDGTTITGIIEKLLRDMLQSRSLDIKRMRELTSRRRKG